LDQNGNVKNEKTWSGSGGGLSSFELEPIYQSTFPIPNNPQQMRGTPDVAYVGNPDTGVAVYDSIPYQGSTGWFEGGGTSVGPPQWAALFAIVKSRRENKAPVSSSPAILYDTAKEQPADFQDVTNGQNGSCQGICKAQRGYDYVTGLGSPQADELIHDLKRLP
jgi:subtilase family serine protease